jgi:hypothetical protein
VTIAIDDAIRSVPDRTTARGQRLPGGREGPEYEHRMGPTMQPWSIGGAATLVLALASCGASTALTPRTPTPPISGSPSATATPAPSPSPTGSLAACTAAAQPASASATAGPVVAVLTQSASAELELVDAAGDVLNETTAGQVSTADVSSPLGVGPEGAYLFNSTSGDVSLLGLSGAPAVIGRVTLTSQLDDVSFAVSPSGRCWILSDTSYDSGGDGTSRLYVSVDAAPPTLLTTLTRSASVNGSFGGGYRILRWDADGVLLGTDPTGVGGGGPFLDDEYTRATVLRLDPLTTRLSPSLCASGRFGDVAPDGTVACVTGEGSDAVIVVSPAQGSPVSIDTGIQLAGHLAFVAGSTVLSYCTSDGNPAPDGASWTEELWTVQLGNATPSPHLVMSGDNSWCESGVVAGADALAVPVGTGSGETPSIEILDLVTGQTTTIHTTGGLLGVL